MATAVKDANFNMRMNRQKKNALESNKETEDSILEARGIMSGQISAKSYSSARELFDAIDAEEN